MMQPGAQRKARKSTVCQAAQVVMSVIAQPSQKIGLLFDFQTPEAVGERSRVDKRVAFGLRRTRYVAGAARIVDEQFQDLPAIHLLEPHLRVGPVERAFQASKIEMHGFARVRHVESNLSYAEQALIMACASSPSLPPIPV